MTSNQTCIMLQQGSPNYGPSSILKWPSANSLMGYGPHLKLGPRDLCSPTNQYLELSRRVLTRPLVSDRYKVTQVELFALLCRLADELLFRQISWIKKLPFFCELSIEDYTCLLSSTWQELILLSCLTIYSAQIFGDLADVTAKYTPSDDELQG